MNLLTRASFEEVGGLLIVALVSLAVGLIGFGMGILIENRLRKSGRYGLAKFLVVPFLVILIITYFSIYNWFKFITIT